MEGGIWLLLTWVSFDLAQPSPWSLDMTVPLTFSLPRVPPRTSQHGSPVWVKVPCRAVQLEMMVQKDLWDLSGPPSPQLKGMSDSFIYSTTLYYSPGPTSQALAIRTSPAGVCLKSCHLSWLLVKGFRGICRCCEARNHRALIRQAKKIHPKHRSVARRWKRHLPSWQENSSVVEAETDAMVGPFPSREAAPRSWNQVEVVKVTSKGLAKDPQVISGLILLTAVTSTLLLAVGALLVHQRHHNAAV